MGVSLSTGGVWVSLVTHIVGYLIYFLWLIVLGIIFGFFWWLLRVTDVQR